ncbi:MAG: NifB/NifX family molybdenum-iron cluster-binding protein [Candidatus Heimdallarchaeota archaeon]|nr:MAG: hypothetical protein DRO91_07005 [Candidatus Heimdallarchaeota archaeon]
MTIIAFPTIDANGEKSKISNHFGRAPYYVLYEKETKQFSVINNKSEHFGGGYKAPSLLEDNHVNVLICQGLGQRALQRFNESNVAVYLTTKTLVEEALRDFNDGKLTLCTESEACEGKGKHH